MEYQILDFMLRVSDTTLDCMLLCFAVVFIMNINVRIIQSSGVFLQQHSHLESIASAEMKIRKLNEPDNVMTPTYP